MNQPWWETYDDRAPMTFPRRDTGTTTRLALTTDPEMYTTKHGQLRLRLKNRHPHEAVRIFGPRILWTR